MRQVTEFELIDHGIDGSQYFQGCGVACTSFDNVVTGCGDNPAEALTDALEQIGSEGVDADDLELRILESEGWTEFPVKPSVAANYPLGQACEECGGSGEIDVDGQDYPDTCETCEGSGEVSTDNSDDLYYYASIRYNTIGVANPFQRALLADKLRDGNRAMSAYAMIGNLR